MYIVKTTKKFRKVLKKYKRSGSFDDSELENVVIVLVSGKKLSKRYKDHKLSGDMKNFWECHVASDLLLIYEIVEDKLVLMLLDLGSHSELFGR